MRCEISVQDLLDHVAEVMVLDERFWCLREGRFEWCVEQVSFRKGNEVIEVVVNGETYQVERF